MVAAACGTAPLPTSGLANVAVGVRSKPNALAARFAFWPSTWMNPHDNAHGSWRTRQSSRRHSGKERRWKRAVRGTQESDRTASPTPAEIKVRAGAVLSSSRCPEHQAIGALPQPADNTHCGSHLLAEVRRKRPRSSTPKGTFRSRTFSTPTAHSANWSVDECYREFIVNCRR